jgi:hypothetical protein
VAAREIAALWKGVEMALEAAAEETERA